MQLDMGDRPKVLLSIYKDGKFRNDGLRGRRLGPGRYRFTQPDRKSLDRGVSGLVNIGEPWGSERTMVRALACDLHGFICPLVESDDHSCSKHFVLIEGCRWFAICALTMTRLDVVIFRRPKAKTLRGAKLGKVVARDVDFTVQLVSRV